MSAEARRIADRFIENATRETPPFFPDPEEAALLAYAYRDLLNEQDEAVQKLYDDFACIQKIGRALAALPTPKQETG